MDPMRCLFVLPSLRGGGAERVTTLLLQHLHGRHGECGGRLPADPQLATSPLDLHLALVEKTGPHVSHVPSGVSVHDLQAGRVMRAVLPLVRLVRRLQPDIVFSTISHLNLAMAMARWTWPAHTRLILRETATCRQILSSANWPPVRRALYRRFYRVADAIVCQTPHMLCDLKRNFQLPAAQLRVIPNPVDFAAIEQLKQSDSCLLPRQYGGSAGRSWRAESVGDRIPTHHRVRSPRGVARSPATGQGDATGAQCFSTPALPQTLRASLVAG